MIAAAILSLFSQIDNWKRDLSINVASLDEKSPDPSLRPLTVPGSVREVEAKITSWANRTPRWSVESSDATDDEATIHLTRTTRIFRWVDDIRIQLRGVDRGTKIDAESRSRVGKGDLGQNPRNLRQLVTAIQAAEKVE